VAENAEPTPAITASVSFDTSPISKNQYKFLVELLRKAKKIKFASSFLSPVDPVALNIPTYFDYVKQPMDLGTMEKKLKDSQYPSADALMSDLGLMVQNSITFNGPNHLVSQAGMNLKAYMNKAMQSLPKGGPDPPPEPKPTKKKAASPPKEKRRESRTVNAQTPVVGTSAQSTETFALLPDGVPLIRRDSTMNDRPKREIVRPQPRDLPYANARPKKKKNQLELRWCQSILDELFKKKHYTYAYPFLQPVDPVALNIPQYHKIIKKPMDLGTVQSNLKNAQYSTAKEVFNDVKLVFDNCFKFNPETDDVHKMGRTYFKLFTELWEDKEEWMAEHAPASEPASVASDEEEEEEEDDEEEEAGLTKRKAAEIQAQIAELAAQLAAAQHKAPKKDKKKKATKPSAPAGKVKRSSSGVGTSFAAKPAAKPIKLKKTPKLTLAQKREVSDGIGLLGEEDMRKAVQIIRNGVPHLQNVNDDELELEIDEIPEPVVYELYRFVRSLNGPKPKFDEDDDFEPPAKAAKATATTGRRKNKPMKAEEQEQKIADLQNKLAEFRGGAAAPASGTEESEDGKLHRRSRVDSQYGANELEAAGASQDQQSSGDEEDASESEEE